MNPNEKDPLDWTVDEVVEFLCHGPDTPWSRSSTPTPRPDGPTFESAIRAHEVDGETLLEDVDRQALREDLGVKALGPASSVLRAIKYLRQRSNKYQASHPVALDQPQSASISQLSASRDVTPQVAVRFGPIARSMIQSPPTSRNNLLEYRPSENHDLTNSPLQARSVAQAEPRTEPPSSVPHVRPQEQCVVDDHGRKRRKLDLNYSNVVTDVTSVESGQKPKSWYLGPEAVKSVDLFYPLHSLPDDTREFSLVGTPLPAGQRLFVQRKLRHFFTQEPIQLDSGEAAVVPYRDGSGPSHFTLYSSQNGKVDIRQEDVQNWPQLNRMLSANAAPTQYSDPFAYLIQNYPAQDGDEDAYPLYGDSGSEGEFDETTWEEIQEEQQQQLVNQAKQRLTRDDVQAIVRDFVDELGQKWQQKHGQKQETKAYRIWVASRRHGHVNQQISKISRQISQLQGRLKKIERAIVGGEYRTSEEVSRQSESMEQTVFSIKALEWERSVLERANCPPKLAASPGAKKKPRPRRPAADEESLGSSSDDELSSFIDDDLSHPTAETRVEVQIPVRSAGLESSSESEDDIIRPGKRKVLLRRASEKAAMPNGSQSASAESPPTTSTPTESASTKPVLPVFSDRSPGPFADVEVVDLTMDSPPDEPQQSLDSDDMAIRTPPLNPTTSVPTPTSASKRRSRSISPAPNLSTTASSQAKRESSARRERTDPQISQHQSDLPDVNDFVGISKKPWDWFAERRDRRRLLAKLMIGLPAEERNELAKFVPQYLRTRVEELQSLTHQAVDAMLNSRQTIRGFEKPHLIMRVGALYVSWVNCVHIGGQKEIARGYLQKALEDAKVNNRGFKFFAQELAKRIYSYQRYFESRTSMRHSVLKEEHASPDSDTLLLPSSSADTPRKKRKREVKERHDVQKNQATAQMRVRLQEHQRKLLAEGMESMGVANDDPAHQAVSFGTPVIYLDPHIGRRVKPHQLSGIQFMWRELIEDENKQGCLLAHTMGLGKTMQVISLLVTISTAAASSDKNVRDQVPKRFRHSKSVILCPSSLVENWYEEFMMWTPKENHLGVLRKVSSSNSLDERLQEVADWDDEGGVLIISYDIFRALILKRGRTFLTDEQHQAVRKSLLEGPSIIAADEAHKMKNPTSFLSEAMRMFKSNSRIAMTGSPLANNLNDYYAMVEWIATGYLGTLVEFKAQYVEPIEEGLYIDSTHAERRRSLKKLQVLKEILDPKINRADISVLAGSLPPKVEFVLTIQLTDIQQKAYNMYVDSVYQKKDDVAATRLWSWLAILSLCCNHPACFREKLASKKANNDRTSDESDPLPGDESVDNAELPESMIDSEMEMFNNIPDVKAFELSHRVNLLQKIVAESVCAGDKVLVFSHSIPTLNYIEYVLKAAGHKYCRLDGSTPVASRQAATRSFNHVNSSGNVFLISTRAGGLGLNIPGANRVVIFDFNFSPIWEEQAVGRAYRLGQLKPVFVYRFLAGGTFEEVMHNKAVFKTQLSYRVVDKKNPVPAAQRKLGEYLFQVRETAKEDLTEYLGKDPQVLDKVLNDKDLKQSICRIGLTETFQREDNDKLTEEEKRDVEKDIEDERLRLTDPATWQLKRQQQLQQEAAALGVTYNSSQYPQNPQYPRANFPNTQPPPAMPPMSYNVPPMDSANLTQYSLPPRPPPTTTTAAVQPISNPSGVQQPGMTQAAGA